VSQPFSGPFTVGAGGDGGTNTANGGNAGGAGTASSFNTNLVANGANGGGATGGSDGTPGTLQNHTVAYINGNTMAEITGGHFSHEGKLVQEETNTLAPVVSLTGTVASGNNPAYLGDSRLKIAGTGGREGFGPQFPSPANGGEGRDGSIVIYEDIG
jgi:hypothetical protein